MYVPRKLIRCTVPSHILERVEVARDTGDGLDADIVSYEQVDNARWPVLQWQ
jgi:hypothetical protein